MFKQFSVKYLEYIFNISGKWKHFTILQAFYATVYQVKHFDRKRDYLKFKEQIEMGGYVPEEPKEK